MDGKKPALPISDRRMGRIDEVVREFAMPLAARPCASRAVTQVPIVAAATGRDRHDNSRTDLSGKPLVRTTALTDALRTAVVILAGPDGDVVCIGADDGFP